MSRNKATLIGLLAIVCWSTIVGLIRSVSEILGATGGAAMIYSAASILLFFTVGIPKINTIPRPYLLWGSLLFVSYELCLALSIGYALTANQAIEIGIVNYLWPSLTMLLAILFTQQKSSLMIIPGVLLSLLGVCWVVGGENGLEIKEITENIQSNPISYVLAFSGAFIWATYCILTSKIAGGANGITIFFILTAIVLWGKYFLESGGTVHLIYEHFNFAHFDYEAMIKVIMAATAMGCGYAFWNTGILHGNITILAGAPYFTPILSSALAAIILQSSLSNSFWQGASMVCTGSILCWLATRARKVK